MAKIEWVFQDESGTNLNRYIATNVETGEKITFDLLRGGNVRIVGTPLNASNLNSLITAINENYDEIATLKTNVNTLDTKISNIINGVTVVDNSNKLNGQNAEYYLNYENLKNTPVFSSTKYYIHHIKLTTHSKVSIEVYFTLIDTNNESYTINTIPEKFRFKNIVASGWVGRNDNDDSLITKQPVYMVRLASNNVAGIHYIQANDYREGYIAVSESSHSAYILDEVSEIL